MCSGPPGWNTTSRRRDAETPRRLGLTDRRDPPAARVSCERRAKRYGAPLGPSGAGVVVFVDAADAGVGCRVGEIQVCDGERRLEIPHAVEERLPTPLL